MAVSFDKNRENYVVRVSWRGKRYYFGRHETLEAAKHVEAKAKAEFEKMDRMTLENYEMKYEKPRKDSFLAAIRKWRRERKKDRETEAKIAQM